jgi:hypothetical protein
MLLACHTNGYAFKHLIDDGGLSDLGIMNRLAVCSIRGAFEKKMGDDLRWWEQFGALQGFQQGHHQYQPDRQKVRTGAAQRYAAERENSTDLWSKLKALLLDCGNAPEPLHEVEVLNDCRQRVLAEKSERKGQTLMSTKQQIKEANQKSDEEVKDFTNNIACVVESLQLGSDVFNCCHLR